MYVILTVPSGILNLFSLNISGHYTENVIINSNEEV